MSFIFKMSTFLLYVMAVLAIDDNGVSAWALVAAICEVSLHVYRPLIYTLHQSNALFLSMSYCHYDYIVHIEEHSI